MSLFTCWIGLTLGSVVCHYIMKDFPWQKVIDISWYQGVALFALWLTMKIYHYTFTKIGQ